MSMPMRWDSCPAPEPLPVPLPTPLRRPRASRRGKALRLSFVAVACLAVGGLATVGAQTLLSKARPASTLRLLPGGATGGQFALSGASVERRLGFVTVTGNAVNHTTQNQSKVEAVVELLDGRSRTVQMESGLLAVDTVRPGETVPFQIDMMDAPNAVTYRVRFKRLMGAVLN